MKKILSSKLLRGIAVFVLCAFIFQAAFMLFMTPEGLAKIYPWVLFWKSEKIKTGDAGTGEYYPLHSEAEEAGLVILSIDTGVEASYSLAEDYLQFLGRFTRLSAVALYTSQSRLSSISEAAVAGDYAAFAEACGIQRRAGILSDQMYEMAEKIYNMNSRLSPDMKFPVCGILGITNFKEVILSLTSDLFISPGGLSGEHIEVVNAKTGEEYVALFKKHEEKLKEVLGAKFERYAELCAAIADDVLEETIVLQNLVKYAPAGGGTVFALLPEHLCADGSSFIKMAEEIYGRVLVTHTEYYNCTTLSDGEETARSDGKFPSFVEGIRIASADDLSGFRKYFDKVSGGADYWEHNGNTGVFGDFGESTFFIVSGSGPVTYGKTADNAETGSAVTDTSGKGDAGADS